VITRDNLLYRFYYISEQGTVGSIYRQMLLHEWYIKHDKRANVINAEVAGRQKLEMAGLPILAGQVLYNY